MQINYVLNQELRTARNTCFFSHRQLARWCFKTRASYLPHSPTHQRDHINHSYAGRTWPTSHLYNNNIHATFPPPTCHDTKMAPIQARRGLILCLVALSSLIFVSLVYRFQSQADGLRRPVDLLGFDHGVNVPVEILHGDAIAPKLGNETIK